MPTENEYEKAVNNILGTDGQSPFEARPSTPNIPKRTYVPIVRKQAKYPSHFEAQSAHTLGGLVDEITWLLQDLIKAVEEEDIETIGKEVLNLLALNESIDNIYLDNIWCAESRKKGKN